MTEREDLLQSIVTTTGDYRTGELSPPTIDHIDRWIQQFDTEVQVPLLHELNYVFMGMYFSLNRVKGLLRALTQESRLTGKVPCDFWRTVNFLNIQQNGHSQEEMLTLFGEILEDSCGFGIDGKHTQSDNYIYLDDIIFSGNRVKKDLSHWLQKEAPLKSTVYIIVIAAHTYGKYEIRKEVTREALKFNKKVIIKFWDWGTFENRLGCRNRSEVLWPTELPNDENMKIYTSQTLNRPFQLRSIDKQFQDEIFASQEGRQLLEREMLLAGLKILSWCQNPEPVMRPLGFSPFGFGFGSMIVTFRNCPNNAPLALWWGNPNAHAGNPLRKWYPLFPRKTYE